MKPVSNLQILCPYHCSRPGFTPGTVRSKGSFRRMCDGKRIRRFSCDECGRSFSEATWTFEFRQRKRAINEFLFTLLASNNSMRRSAKITRLARKTVDHRLGYFGKVADRYQKDLLRQLTAVKNLHFDDMESSEHTKMKPVSIPLAVEHPSRLIISYGVASMPAKGLLAKKSLKKYGPRKDERPKAWRHVLTTASKVAVAGVVITSDSHRRYPAFIRECMPYAEHRTVKGRRGCVAGQGELKVGGWDPLFSLNHTAAMLRANICRLIRRTWCTTKLQERLHCHIALYTMWHNENILAKRSARVPRFPFP